MGNDKRRDYFAPEEVAFGFSSDQMSQFFPLSDEKQSTCELTNPHEIMSTNVDSIVEFVRTIEDIIRMGKNVIICRNFDNLKHESNWAMSENPSSFAWCCSLLGQMFRKAAPCCSNDYPNKRKRKYIDVWLVDFFSEPDGIVNDRKHLFMLQVRNELILR